MALYTVKTDIYLLVIYLHLSYVIFILFYWHIVALQCCVSFCWTTEWISYMNTYIPSPLTLLPTLPPRSLPRRSSQSPELSSLLHCFTLPLPVCPTRGGVYSQSCSAAYLALALSPPHHHAHMSLLCVCTPVPTLQTDSSVPSF